MTKSHTHQVPRHQVRSVCVHHAHVGIVLYLDVMVNGSVCCPHPCPLHSRIGSLQTVLTVSVLGAGGAPEGPGQAVHLVQGDGSFCAAQSRISGEGFAEGRLATESLIRPQIPFCSGQGSVSGSLCGPVPACDSHTPPRAMKGNWTLQSEVRHAGDEIPKGGGLMVRRCPRIQQGEVRAQAKVPLQGQISFGPILQGRQRVIVQTTVFGASQHACRGRKMFYSCIQQGDFICPDDDCTTGAVPGRSPVCDSTTGKFSSLII